MTQQFILNQKATPTAIGQYLLNEKIIEHKPMRMSLEKPGEGNMNLVLRFKFDGRSLILKQSKPYVNKYPDIPAPAERIHTEAVFYQYANTIGPIKNKIPEIIHYDPENHLIVMEDLGSNSDFSWIYEKDKKLSDADFSTLVHFMSVLHKGKFTEREIERFPDNLALRKLNHQHIFILPFDAENGFPLDDIQSGLKQLAVPYTQDKKLKNKLTELGDKYLSEGRQLIHGDFYPGSWIQTNDGLKIIDPEFGFMGFPEFELGVFVAHLWMAGQSLENTLTATRELYPPGVDWDEVRSYAAAEVMRRIIGIAQLPLDMELDEKKSILAEASTILLHED